METSIIVAVIGGVATVSGAAIALVKKRSDATAAMGAPESPLSLGNVSARDANLAIGNNITQTYTSEVHHHHVDGATLLGAVPARVTSIPTPTDIEAALRAATPYNQTQLSKSYSGLQVCWRVAFSGMSEPDDTDDGVGWLVYFRFPEKVLYGVEIMTRLKLENYPKFKVIKSGHEVWISGRIRYVHAGGIYIENNPEIDID
jgi:hypothetical protein